MRKNGQLTLSREKLTRIYVRVRKGKATVCMQEKSNEWGKESRVLTR